MRNNRHAYKFKWHEDKLTAAEKWWNECAEYERRHEIAFASPRALLEARMMAALDTARRSHHRARPNGAHRRRKAGVG
ncbi:MAG: hypothetical protein C5B50_02085 [Verrucomicrobia bacterium]|nr:MAG: hypothetical protein C5B50_02085 [Verrucomicrobiota bacterium]